MHGRLQRRHGGSLRSRRLPLGIGSVPRRARTGPGVLRVDALAARLAAHLVLAREAAGVEWPQVHQLIFEVEDFFINVLRGEWFFHIRYYIYDT